MFHHSRELVPIALVSNEHVLLPIQVERYDWLLREEVSVELFDDDIHVDIRCIELTRHRLHLLARVSATFKYAIRRVSFD